MVSKKHGKKSGKSKRTIQRLIVLDDRLNYTGLSVYDRLVQEYLQSKTNKK